MKVKINHTLFITLSLITLLIAGNYWGIAQFVLPYKARLYILVLSGAIPLLLPLYYKKRSIIIPWMLCFFFVLFRNQEFLSGGYYNSIRLIGAYLFIFASVKSCDWIKKAPQIITAVGIANVIATLLFFVNNGLYQLFISTTYKQYQDGTQDGLYGYRAALADHYSQNGTYIAIVLLTVWAVFLTLNGHEKKRKYIMIAGIATVIALLLTSKRAHLLFGVATLIVVYYVVNPEKRLLKSFKLMMAAAAALIGLNFLMDYVPDIARVFERFQTAGSDNASLLRILMWDRACSIFNQNPILGIGWYGFRYKSGLSALTGATAGCHNIYLELLCETGLLGFCVFIMAMASSIVITWKNINYLSHQERDVELTSIKLALSVSFAIQFFVLLYGMTGNPIYDSTFCFYAVAVAINISFTSNMRGRI